VAEFVEMVRLHEEEMSAYRAYVGARETGENEDELRKVWLAAHTNAIVGGVTPEWRREFLQSRAGGDVKRSR
jgi:hypothetical protein